MCSYNLDNHRKRFAAWAATTAARSSKKCRFTRNEGLLIIERSGLSEFARWADLPHPHDFDAAHRVLRTAICSTANDILGKDPARFTHGVAAKLINVYLKCMFLTGAGFEAADPRIRAKANALHPPIDRLLLTSLAAKDIGGKSAFWRQQSLKGWSNFTSEDYETTIAEVRDVTNGTLWKIEQHWLEP